MNPSEKLFSYGTLRYEHVQLSTFGRKLEGKEDFLIGFRQSFLEITDPSVLAISSEAVHPILVYTGNPEDKILGMVFELSYKEIELADKYEVSDYKRVSVKLKSGLSAWVYVDKNVVSETAS